MTNALRRLALGVALVAGTTSCSSDATSPWEPLRWEQTSVRVYEDGTDPVDRNPSSDRSPEPPSVSVSGDLVSLQGVIITPDPCVELSVDASTLTQVMEVNVVVRRPPQQGCATVLGVFEYLASARHRSGTYRLRVVHHYPAASSNPRHVALDTIVVIE